MGALTPAVNVSTEFAGKYKLVVLTATIASASDTITLTEKTALVVSFVAPIGAVITGGMGTNFANIQVSVSGLVVTIASFKSTFAAADTFSGTTVAVSILGKTTSVA